jgi:outer membrane protein OmpA-like peptidoglycan-associated protein
MKKYIVLLVLGLFWDLSLAQDKKKNNSFDAEAFKAQVEALAKTEKENASKNTNQRGGRSSSIKNSYERLTEAEKAIVKDLPLPPDVFRTVEEAQAFEDKLKGKDLMKMLNENAAASINLKAFLINYQSVRQKTSKYVKDAAVKKAKFKKENPNINFGNNTEKTYICKNDLVYLPLGEASFADEVVTATRGSGAIQFPEKNCIGTPDYVEKTNVKDNLGVYNLGLGGSLVVKFTNNALVDVNGTDLYIFEMGEIEPTNLEISTDGQKWLSVGTISGGVAEVDISKVAQANEYYYFVRLTDLKTQSTVPGADVDAVAAIGGAMRLSLNAEVLFDFGKSDLKPEGIQEVKKLAKQLLDVQKASINIMGYTDDTGSDEANQKLSLQRAESVSRILKSEIGNNQNLLFKTKGLGKQNPIVPNTSDENRKKNRRVEVVVSGL